MSMKILFIDEQRTEQMHFLDYLDKHPEYQINLEAKFPLASIDEMVESILESHPDAIITDYRLNEYKTDISYNIPYTGADLIRELGDKQQIFPCFILTSFNKDAVDTAYDVNVVYEKSVLNDDTRGGIVTFMEKVIRQIKNYKTRLKEIEDAYVNLLDKRTKGLCDISDEYRLIELDDLLENKLDTHHTLPKEFKETSNAKRITALLARADALIRKLDSDV